LCAFASSSLKGQVTGVDTVFVKPINTIDLDTLFVAKPYVDSVVDAEERFYETDGSLDEDRTVTLNGNDLIFDGSLNVYILSSGHVGINDPTPEQNFDVTGDMEVENGNYKIYLGPGLAGVNYIQFYDTGGPGGYGEVWMRHAGMTSLNSNSVVTFKVSNDGGVHMPTLRTTLTLEDLVGMDVNGELMPVDPATISGANIYSSDGTVTAARDIDKDGNDVTFSGSGDFIISGGNFGVGETNPGALAHYKGGAVIYEGTTNKMVRYNWTGTGSRTLVAYQENGVDQMRLFSGGSANHAWYNDQTSEYQLVLKSTGNVGINYLNANEQLVIGGGGNLEMNGGGDILHRTNSSSKYYNTANSGHSKIDNPGSGSELAIHDGSGEVVRVTGGEIGVKTSTPNALLDVGGIHSGITNTTIGVRGTGGTIPELSLFRDAGGGPGNAGYINYYAKDNLGNAQNYVRVTGDIQDPTDGSEDGRIIWSVANAGLVLQKMALNYLGYLGIGALDAEMALHIEGTSHLGSRMKIERTGIGEVEFGAYGDIYNSPYIETVGNYHFDIFTNSTFALRVDNQQRVGIGTNVPNKLLHIQSSNASGGVFATTSGGTAITSSGNPLIMTNDNQTNFNYATMFFSDGSTQPASAMIAARFLDHGTNQGDLQFWTRGAGTNNGIRMTIEDDGDVGIGLTDPWARLVVSGSDITTAQTVLSLAEGATAYMHWQLDDTNNEVIFRPANGNDVSHTNDQGVSMLFLDESTGFVGIGNEKSPSTALEVNGTVTATAFVGDGSGLTGIATSDDQTIDFLNLNGTTLEISLEDDGEANQTVDLASLQDGTGTDDQTFDVSSFDAANHRIQLSIEGDGEATKNIDLPYALPPISIQMFGRSQSITISESESYLATPEAYDGVSCTEVEFKADSGTTSGSPSVTVHIRKNDVSQGSIALTTLSATTLNFSDFTINTGDVIDFEVTANNTDWKGLTGSVSCTNL